MPPKQVEHHRGNLPLILPDGSPDRLDLSPSAVIAGIHDNGCWLLAGRAERLDGYGTLLDRVLEALDPLLPRDEGGIEREHVNYFVGSPGAVVPVHFDRHHGFLLQIEGSKEITVAAPDDPVVAGEIDHFFDADENARVLPLDTQTFALEPGDGIYLPPYALHWVEGGVDVSVAVSCEVRTRTTVRAQLVHECNARLRRLHLSPRPPGRSERVDRAKAMAMSTWRRGRARVDTFVRR